MTKHHSQSAPLRSALWQNGLFSGLSGLLFLIAPNAVGDFLGAGPSWLFLSLGVGLILFAADLAHQASREQLSPLRALVSSMADFSWVLGSALFLAFGLSLVTSAGGVAIAVVAVIVLQFGLRQMRGIVRLFRDSDAPGKLVYCNRFHTSAPAAAIWRVIADLGSISDYAANLSASRIKNGVPAGVGAARECTDTGGKSWTETCTEFVPQSHLLLEFDTNAPGFPFPVSEMEGGWRVIPADRGSYVEVWWELVTKPEWAAGMILPLMTWQVERNFPAMLKKMEEAAQGSCGDVGREVLSQEGRQ